MAKATPKRYASLLEKDPTKLHEAFAKWIEDEVGYEPDLKTVQIAVSLRIPFQRSDANQKDLAARKAAAIADREARAKRAEERAAKREAKANAPKPEKKVAAKKTAAKAPAKKVAAPAASKPAAKKVAAKKVVAKKVAPAKKAAAAGFDEDDF